MALSHELEAQIVHHYRAERWTVGMIAHHLNVHHSAVTRVVHQAGLTEFGLSHRRAEIDRYLPFIRQALETFPMLAASELYTMVSERGYGGSREHFRHVIACLRPSFDARGWMLTILQKTINVANLAAQTRGVVGLEILLERLYTGGRFERNKSLSILGYSRGLSIHAICQAIGISTNTYWQYKGRYLAGGVEALFMRNHHMTKRSDDELLKATIFKTLHEQPCSYGINRTTWTMQTLRRVLDESGNGACPEVIRTITRAAGYHWRKARIVLTSEDPNYREKLDRIHSILRNLQSNEAFFSIDEYGPFAIKLRGGRKLTGPDQQSVVPQWQTSRGCLIITAAVELSSNQVTHFYSNKKNTKEMIAMMDLLAVNYADRQRIYLSWDGASWHTSKELKKHIDEHNGNANKSGGVLVETAPLPVGAQFLNVIESIFSGMSRAIMHNSDYKSIDETKRAIDRYYTERNEYFQLHPRSAGKKIWGKEREPPVFSEANNCKDQRYR